MATRNAARWGRTMAGAGAALVLVAAAQASAHEGAELARIVSVDSLLANYRLPDGTALKSLPIGVMSQSSVSLLQARTGVRAHYHAQSDEVIYVLAGRGVLHMAPDGDKITARALAAVPAMRLKPGMVVLMPRGTAHMIDVQGNDPLAVLSVFSPSFHAEDRVALRE